LEESKKYWIKSKKKIIFTLNLDINLFNKIKIFFFFIILANNNRVDSLLVEWIIIMWIMVDITIWYIQITKIKEVYFIKKNK
jgi:hypothetical protein